MKKSFYERYIEEQMKNEEFAKETARSKLILKAMASVGAKFTPTLFDEDHEEWMKSAEYAENFNRFTEELRQADAAHDDTEVVTNESFDWAKHTDPDNDQFYSCDDTNCSECYGAWGCDCENCNNGDSTCEACCDDEDDTGEWPPIDLEELDKRVEDLRSGKVQAIPLEDVLARLKERAAEHLVPLEDILYRKGLKIVGKVEVDVVLTPDMFGGYTIECPAIPGCISQGDTVDEALENIKEAIEASSKD